MGELLSKPVTETHATHESNARLFVASSSMQGYRVTMEDGMTFKLDFPATSTDQEISYFAVFDGHNGAEVALECEKRLHELLTASEYYQQGKYIDALTQAFVNMDEEFIEEKVTAGAAAIVVLIVGNTVYVANAGDCRAILSITTGTEVLELSEDHKPNLPEEEKRIVAAGGHVVKYSVGEDARLNGVFSLSRSFGDVNYKTPIDYPPDRRLMSAYPEIRSHKITEDEEYLVIACDGIWSVASSIYVKSKITQLLCQLSSRIYSLKDRQDKETITGMNEGKLTKLASSGIEKICDSMMLDCLRLQSFDNMSMMLILFLKGKTLLDWLFTFQKKHASQLNDIFNEERSTEELSKTSTETSESFSSLDLPKYDSGGDDSKEENEDDPVDESSPTTSDENII